MKILTERAELALKEQKKIWRVTNDDLMRRLELMSKEKDAKDAEHAVDMHEVIIDVKASANVVV